jgi:hypothetical protein
MRAWIDTEFNETGGQLISMAIVTEEGHEFYEVLDIGNVTPWVHEHVLPVLGKAPVTFTLFQGRLSKFLFQFQKLHLIADWPEDLKYFCESLIVGPGQRIPMLGLTMEIDYTLPDTAAKSKIPHNALEDARALRN